MNLFTGKQIGGTEQPFCHRGEFSYPTARNSIFFAHIPGYRCFSKVIMSISQVDILSVNG
ncbi:hypothetical protein S1OALGB6SA_773 [Olavius algarvensis spirochete endosymbiont]|nr:hypothetical protein S1OALGB6SA_773 [Olavius algarvensis spirochete endosymbiont]